MDLNASLPTVSELAEQFGLTHLQARFVQELVASGFNAAEAARRAGYGKASAKKMGYRNLEKPHIQAAVAAVTKPLTEQAAIEAGRVLEEGRRLAFSNILDYVEWDAEGRVTVRPSADLDRALGGAIKKIKSKTRRYESYSETTLEIELHRKTKPLELLGKYFGLWTDPMEFQAQILQVFNQLSPGELEQLERMDDEELLELIEERGIYRLPEVFR